MSSSRGPANGLGSFPGVDLAEETPETGAPDHAERSIDLDAALPLPHERSAESQCHAD
jgi:hypothetical protein